MKKYIDIFRNSICSIIALGLLQSCIQNNSKAPVAAVNKKQNSIPLQKQQTPITTSKTVVPTEVIEEEEDEIDYKFELRRFNQLFKKKRDLDHYKYNNECGTILIGYLFKSAYKYAVMNCRISESKIKTVLLRNRENNWDTVFIKYSASSFSSYMAPQQTIELKDFDGDSIPDLWAIYSFGDIHIWYAGNLWLFKNDTFREVVKFSNIANPEYDYTTNSIVGYQSDGCSDMRMAFERHKIKQFKTIKIESIYCDCCDSDSTGNCIVFNNNSRKIVPKNKAHLYVPNNYKQQVKNILMHD